MTEPSKDEFDSFEEEPKWDYTSNRETMITGAAVVAANLLVLILYLLYKYVPSVHQFITGRPWLYYLILIVFTLITKPRITVSKLINVNIIIIKFYIF